jgi:predicted dithiol-disulfide oxidoreductase (DUF899 family)
MSLPEIATREEWLAAREALLAEEKALTRRRDELSARRRRLPMVEITEPYVFTGPGGRELSLLDLFEGRRQLIVYHFMYDPSWDVGCSSCSAGADEVAPGFLAHLHTRDTTFAYVSLAPIEKLEAWKAQNGWPTPWYSSHGTTFNRDFGVTIDWEDGTAEIPATSCFLQDGGRVFHTYQTFARGLESVGGSYYWLDLTALGRQEEWEEPKGRADTARGAVPNFSE